MSFWKSIGKIGHKITKSVGSIGDSVHDAVGDVGHKIVKTTGNVASKLASGDVGGAGHALVKGAGSVGHAVVSGAGDVGHTVANDELVQTAHNIFTKIPTRLANQYKAELAWIPYFGQANLVFGDLVNRVVNPEDYQSQDEDVSEPTIDASVYADGQESVHGAVPSSVVQVTYTGADSSSTGVGGNTQDVVAYAQYLRSLASVSPVNEVSSTKKVDLTWLPMVASVLGLISSL